MKSLWDLPEIERRGADLLRHPPRTFQDAIELGPFELRDELPISAICDRRYEAHCQSGSRPLSAIRWIVLHTTEGSTAAGAAKWFEDRRSKGSAHLVVDGKECYRTLPPTIIPWGAPGANGHGWHLELAGFARRPRNTWLQVAANRRTLERGAYKLALHAHAFGIPIRRLTLAQLRAGELRGVIDHNQCSKVFGGDHTDVGPWFPWDTFTMMARAHARRLRLAERAKLAAQGGA